VSDPLLRGELCFVELPVPGAAQRGAPAVDAEALQELMANGLTDVQAHAALAAAGNDLQRAVGALLAQRMARPDAQALQELLLNGVSQEDAAAALEAKGGDVEEALLFCLETADRGGPAKLARRGKAPRGAAPAPPTGEAQARAAAAEAARKAAEVKEVAAVLQRFEAHGGVSSARVERVERVQNLVLWRDFAQRRARLELEARSGANMQRLFHGAAKVRDECSARCRRRRRRGVCGGCRRVACRRPLPLLLRYCVSEVPVSASGRQRLLCVNLSPRPRCSAVGHAEHHLPRGLRHSREQPVGRPGCGRVLCPEQWVLRFVRARAQPHRRPRDGAGPCGPAGRRPFPFSLPLSAGPAARAVPAARRRRRRHRRALPRLCPWLCGDAVVRCAARRQRLGQPRHAPPAAWIPFLKWGRDLGGL
jgi:hypothetical protein